MDEASTRTGEAGESGGDWVEAARGAAVIGSFEVWVLSSLVRIGQHDDDDDHILRGLD